MTQTEALKLALEALEDYVQEYGPHDKDSGAAYIITAIKEALAQPDVDRRSTESKETFDQQEPVAWMDKEVGAAYLASELDANDDCAGLEPLYISPPKQEFVCSTGLCHYKALKQEPVAWQYRDLREDGFWSAWIGCDKPLPKFNGREVRALYTTPPQRKPLTDEEIRKHLAIAKSHEQTWLMFARAIEAAHGIKGEA